MDWGLISTILIFVVGSFLSYKSATEARLRRAEAENRLLELKGIHDSIKRIHHRIDDVEKSNEDVLKQLTDPDRGLFVRIAKIETHLKLD